MHKLFGRKDNRSSWNMLWQNRQFLWMLFKLFLCTYLCGACLTVQLNQINDPIVRYFQKKWILTQLRMIKPGSSRKNN